MTRSTDRKIARTRERIGDFGAYAIGRINDRVQRGRGSWSVRTAILEDLRDLSEAFWKPDGLGRFDHHTIHDVDAAFVADPFLIRRDDSFHLFVEVWDRSLDRGVIGHAASTDGHAWQWRGVVLEEPFHLSYPFVIEVAGEVAMIPECNDSGAVRMYVAEEFPTRWTYAGDLRIPSDEVKDASFLRHDDRWWCFADTSQGVRNDTLRLFSAPALSTDAEWVEHPSSPIILEDRVRARPAGRPVRIDGAVHRLSQNCATRYGTGVRAHRIEELSASSYVEDRRGQILLHPSGRGWNRTGMHHVSTLTLEDGRMLVAVDGY